MKKTSIRSDLFRFLKNPGFTRMENLSGTTKIVILFKVLILTYIGIIIAQMPYQILNGLNLMDEVSKKGLRVIQAMSDQKSDYRPYFIFSTVLFAPILEETAFRFFLTKFKINYFIISVSLIVGSFIMYFISNLLWRPESFLLFSLSTYIYVFIISGIIGWGLWLLRNNLIEIKEFWNSNARFVFYSVAILFALFHLMNFNLNVNNFLYAPILILPFFVFGLSFGYIRIRLGLIYSVILHIVILGIWFGLPQLIIALKT